jgi:hypothetical protein
MCPVATERSARSVLWSPASSRTLATIVTLSVAPGVSMKRGPLAGKGVPFSVTSKIRGGSASMRVIGSPRRFTVRFMACWVNDPVLAFCT